MLESLVAQILLLSYGMYKDIIDITTMKTKNFSLSPIYKFLNVSTTIRIFFNLSILILMIWVLLFDTKEESCHFFGFCIILTNTSFIGLLFGVSILRFMSVLKEKKFLNVILIEEFVWKFLIPILIAVSMTIFITKDHQTLMGMKQVKKHPLITLL